MSVRPPTLRQARAAQIAMTGRATMTAPTYRPSTRLAAPMLAISSCGPERPRSTPRRLSRENFTGVICPSEAELVLITDQLLYGGPESSGSATPGGVDDGCVGRLASACSPAWAA